ncbi:IclR family transcriptional regulator [Bacillus massiliglaciei]|uniref:IclR family transcriptional regulator n=1 Tax=Bacillus massiliglaciei TaxID=1816693 RepID=UPI000AD001D4|nr:IclR family transcriptional regulator [Bacillus massiliglaciei]
MPNKTVVKSMQVLNLFLDHPKLTFNQMVEHSALPKTSLHRMVRSLEEMGFLEKNKDGFYSLGLLFLQFGQLVSKRLDIREIALPVMKELRDQVEEAVNLLVRERDEAIYIEKLDTLQPVRLYTSVGRRSPLYAGDSRILLAYLEDNELESYLSRVDLVPIGIGTITDKKELKRRLSEARDFGYSISRSELENYTASVSAPVFNSDGQVIAGISIAGIEARYQEERLPKLIRQVKESAEKISKRMGGVQRKDGGRNEE